MYVDLELVKQHVRSDEFAADDAYLSHLTEVAEQSVIRATNRDAEELLEMGDGSLPLPLVQAVLLQIGHYYNQREAVGTQVSPVPYALEYLIKPFRRLVSEEEEEES